ncbi:conserved hypothetical protein [Magnetospirillum sp. LM-5]|uniref:hypothetical protein n=1 Tax=Magnetospirillum sp. LM-5 TaxID=2681466 RepID=UPI00137FE51E|nr:hypothetical protein [Magnetospirillum sp. LM-5]CAA7621441.1 conserved hypothetical protein [Magnetospirillum sp. LM-5]
MPDPMKDLNAFQAAWFQAWATASRQSLEMWKHLFEAQHRMLHQVSKYHRDHVEIATGASFTDKYGKRAHDIDPERDV